MQSRHHPWMCSYSCVVWGGSRLWHLFCAAEITSHLLNPNQWNHGVGGTIQDDDSHQSLKSTSKGDIFSGYNNRFTGNEIYFAEDIALFLDLMCPFVIWSNIVSHVIIKIMNLISQSLLGKQLSSLCIYQNRLLSQITGFLFGFLGTVGYAHNIFEVPIFQNVSGKRHHRSNWSSKGMGGWHGVSGYHRTDAE